MLAISLLLLLPLLHAPRVRAQLPSPPPLAPALLPPGVAFVPALDYDGAVGYRETHAAACTRAGMQATQPALPLRSAGRPNATWDADTVRAAIASLLPAARPEPGGLVGGCCAPSLFCRADRAAGARTCATHALGGYAYVNVGWTLNASATPVYTCAAPAAAGAAAPAPSFNVTNVTAALPAVGAVRLVNDSANYYGQRLQINGTGFGDDTRALQAYVGGVACAGVEVCHNQCRRCSRTAQCGNDKVCLLLSGTGYCIRLCDWPAASGVRSCPCGLACYEARVSGSTLHLCASRNARSPSDAPMCTPNALVPPAGSNMTDHIECTPAWAARDSSAHAAAAGGDGGGGGGGSPYPDNPGPRRLADGAWGAAARGSPAFVYTGPPVYFADPPPLEAGVGRVGRRRRDDAAAAAAAAAGSGSPAQAQRALPRRGIDGDDVARRRALQAAPAAATQLGGAAAAGHPRLGGTTALAGYRYDATCPLETVHAGAYDVVVVRAGWASSGVGVAAYAAAGVPLPLSAGSGGPPFQALPVAGRIPSVSLTSNATRFDGCRSSSDCPWVDVCSRPRCVPQAPLANVSCCVYEPTARCASAPALPADGWGPQRHAYVLLPREVAAVLPMPPPPRGALSVLGAAGCAQTANMSVRQRQVNPTAISWDPSSTWYTSAAVAAAEEGGPAAAVAGAAPAPPPATVTVRPFAAPYNLSARVSQADDGPLDPAPLPFAVPFYGQQLRELSVGANGFLRVTSDAPCFGSFSATGCDILDGYAGVITPIASDFEPCQYDDAEIYFGAWDASALAERAVAAGVPSAQVACGVWLNLGLYTTSDRTSKPPDPSFTFQACVHGDGAVRMRYGQVFGVPGYSVRDWSPSTAVARDGGPPNASLQMSWLAGVRSLSATYHLTEDVDFAGLYAPVSGAGSPLVGSQDVDLAIPTQTLLSRQGVKQGGTVSMCAFSPIACASPSCGGAGTLVVLRWTPPGCGLGLDGLLAGSSTRPPAPGGRLPVPRIECVFGGVAVMASVNRSAAAGADERPIYEVTCAAPAPLVVGSSATVVPLLLQLVLGASRAAYEPRGGGALSLAGGLLSPAGNNGSSNASTGGGIGPEAPWFHPADGVAILPLDVYGVECMSGDGTCREEPGGPAAGAFLVSKPLTFTYSADGAQCGCSSGDATAVCDACGVCGGDGAFVDCAGECFGLAFVDDCAECTGGTTGAAPNKAMDCAGECGGKDTTCVSTGTSGCAGSNSDAGGGAGAGAGSMMQQLVLIALVVCTLALTTVMFIVGWNSLQRSTREFELGDLFGGAGELTLQDLGVSPGLSAASLAAIPPIEYDPVTAKRAGGGDDGEPDLCAICMDNLAPGDAVRVLPPCKHCYHVGCIDTWLGRSTVCPTCRAELRSPAELRQLRRARRTIQRQRAIMMGQRPAGPGMDDTSSGGSGTDTDGGGGRGGDRASAAAVAAAARRPPAGAAGDAAAGAVAAAGGGAGSSLHESAAGRGGAHGGELYDSDSSARSLGALPVLALLDSNRDAGPSFMAANEAAMARGHLAHYTTLRATSANGLRPPAAAPTTLGGVLLRRPTGGGDQAVGGGGAGGWGPRAARGAQPPAASLSGLAGSDTGGDSSDGDGGGAATAASRQPPAGSLFGGAAAGPSRAGRWPFRSRPPLASSSAQPRGGGGAAGAAAAGGGAGGGLAMVLPGFGAGGGGGARRGGGGGFWGDGGAAWSDAGSASDSDAPSGAVYRQNPLASTATPARRAV